MRRDSGAVGPGTNESAGCSPSDGTRFFGGAGRSGRPFVTAARNRRALPIAFRPGNPEWLIAELDRSVPLRIPSHVLLTGPSATYPGLVSRRPGERDRGHRDARLALSVARADALWSIALALQMQPGSFATRARSRRLRESAPPSGGADASSSRLFAESRTVWTEGTDAQPASGRNRIESSRAWPHAARWC
jgi:hypothetical protein